jgi:signal transduction histidine kinase
LEFSRRPRLRIQQVSPSEIVAATLQVLEHRLKAYNVELHIERPSGPLPEVEADPEQLKEVLVNLIINACEAMEGGGTITIREEIERKGKDSVARIRVMDTGPGIPRVLQGKVMQPFFTTKDEGTGLGLSIAARILEEHGGSLELDSEEGRGAAFTITLPLDKSTYE